MPLENHFFFKLPYNVNVFVGKHISWQNLIDNVNTSLSLLGELQAALNIFHSVHWKHPRSISMNQDLTNLDDKEPHSVIWLPYLSPLECMVSIQNGDVTVTNVFFSFLYYGKWFVAWSLVVPLFPEEDIKNHLTHNDRCVTVGVSNRQVQQTHLGR